jgi:hypothetical protein
MQPAEQGGLAPDLRRLARTFLRLVGLVVFAYWSILLAFAAFNLMTPQQTVRGTYGPYPIPAALAVIGMAASIFLGYRQLRTAGLTKSLAWLAGGAAAMYAWTFVVVTTQFVGT